MQKAYNCVVGASQICGVRIVNLFCFICMLVSFVHKYNKNKSTPNGLSIEFILSKNKKDLILLSSRISSEAFSVSRIHLLG